MVHWVGDGSNVIICLARDSTPRINAGLSPSALFISYDNGKNFTNKTEDFRLGDTPDSGYAQVDKFFNHPKHSEFCVFTDSANKKLYYTSDNGRNIHRSDLSFSPSELAFDEELPDKYVILDKVDTNRKLYLTLDGGKTFKMIQSNVKTFFWLSGSEFSKLIYVERLMPDGTSTVFSASDPTDLINADVLFEEVKDFQIKGDYMFATKQSKERNTLHLYISYQRGPFMNAEFQTELDLRNFHIADVTEKRIFVSVMHTESLSNLYVSEIGRNFTQYNFVLSLERIFCYFPNGNWRDTWLEDVTEDSFTDLYRVEGLKGIYIGSQVDSKSSVAHIGPEHLVSLITFDHGVTWSPIKPPTEDENGKPLNCHVENSCSLHLCQKFSELYPLTRSASIMSSKSAPGIIMATGVMGKSLKGLPGVYISRDAGLTWKRILKDFYFFNYGDHGGVLVAVKYFKSRGETRRILYSTNEGVEWNSYQFNADELRIYGLMTEPGENTTTFTMFGSANNQDHQWIVITIDLKNTFARNCTQDDYKFWSPSPPHSSVSCVLGSKNVFQRRLAHTDCYNGIDYQRSVKKEVCECTRKDYKCDFGFMLLGEECIQNKSVKYEPYAIPSDCRPGQYYMQTKGYRKIDGNVCTVSGYSGYAPEMIPCPIEQPTEFMLVAMRDKIARIDLTNNVTLYPVEGQKNILAIEFDVKNNCIYWADIQLDRISRQCFNNGSKLEIIVDTDLVSVEGMALDWISNVLFFVDGVRKKIEAVRTDLINEGSMRLTILDQKVLFKPRGIAVHPKAGYLFWTDWHATRPSVSRSNLDGTDVMKLFGKPIVHWPNGITVDLMSERIVWVDAKEHYIASSDLNGQYFRKILWNNDMVGHPFAVAVLKDKMYWDDWKAKSIFIADKDTGLNVVTINNSFSGLMGLKVFAHSVQHGSNACSFKNTTCNALCLGMPGNNIFSCLCPDGFKKVNGSCVCPDGVKPFANMTCPKTAGTTNDPVQVKRPDVTNCTDNGFLCGNDTDICIPNSWVCDGEPDCPSGSDESQQRCNSSTCAPFMFSCPSGKCISKSWVCDGDNDCNDQESSDEQNCTNIGYSKQLTEPNTIDCLDWMLKCNNGNCVPDWWRCDGIDDCGDHSDEVGCGLTLSETKPLNSDDPTVRLKCENQFRCTPVECVPLSWVCDGTEDCPNGVDERNCAAKTRPAVMCTSNETLCVDKKFCVKYDQVCDGVPQCVDHSDEIHCPILQFLSIGVDQLSINSTSFLTSCWIPQQKTVVYSFLPSISKVSDGKWTNMSWINDSTYRFTNLKPYTVYNVTCYIRNIKSNKTYASNKYVNAGTREGVPSPPRELTVKQLIGNRVQMSWNQPENPNGDIEEYELYYSPPTPPIKKTVPANDTNEQSAIFKESFNPNTNYSFWVKAANSEYTSNSSEVMYLSFDEGGEIVNVSISEPTASVVYLEWNRIRGAEGYSLKLQLPMKYKQRDVVTTKNNNITFTDFPPGVQLYINIQAYKNSEYSEPFTVPLLTQGEPDDVLNLTAILLKEKQTSVQLSWSPPNGERYKNKELQYEVHYVNIIRSTIPVEISNDTQIITKGTSIVIDDLQPCGRYMFSVALLGGPLGNFVDITMKENKK